MRGQSVLRESATSVERHIRSLCQLFTWIGGAALLTIMMVTAGNVVLRLLGHSQAGAVELSSLLFVIAMGLGLSYTTIERGHVEIELVARLLPARVQLMLAVIMNVLSLGLWIVITWRVFVFGMEQYRLGEHIPVLNNMPTAPWRFVLVVGLAVLCLILLMQLIQLVAKVVRR